MKITYAITVHNEPLEIARLLTHILENKRKQDDIVVLDDYSTEQTLNVLEMFGENITVHKHSLNKDFATHKNVLFSKCEGDFIFNIDADEIPHRQLLQDIPSMIEENPEIDLIKVPRINIVTDMPDGKMEEWKWSANEAGWINYPDWQSRIFKNTPNIKYEGAVHETLTGYSSSAHLEAVQEMSLYHIKTFEKQVECTKLYAKIAPETVPPEFRNGD
jgi:glycosyltransferase involved in cell wall biosynthesis